MGSAFVLKNYVSKNQQNKLFVYPDSGSDRSSSLKTVRILNPNKVQIPMTNFFQWDFFSPDYKHISIFHSI